MAQFMFPPVAPLVCVLGGGLEGKWKQANLLQIILMLSSKLGPPWFMLTMTLCWRRARALNDVGESGFGWFVRFRAPYIASTNRDMWPPEVAPPAISSAQTRMPEMSVGTCSGTENREDTSAWYM